jgi:hypothetical protein
MVTLAALALIGFHANAEPWVNALMGVPKADAVAQLKKDDDSTFLLAADGKTSISVSGDPTTLVWAMNSTDDGEDEFSLSKLLDQLGFDGKRVSSTTWDRGDEVKTPIIKGLAGLKEGWIPMVGAYDLLFVGPGLAGDFDVTSAGIKTDAYALGLADFFKDPTWEGAVSAYGKAQHMELMDADLYVLTWRGQGIITEVGLEMDLTPDEEGKDMMKTFRTDKDCVSQLGFTFRAGVKDWKEAFRAAGLDSTGVTFEKDEDDPDFGDFANVKGLPEGWHAYGEFVDGGLSFLAIREEGTD